MTEDKNKDQESEDQSNPNNDEKRGENIHAGNKAHHTEDKNYDEFYEKIEKDPTFVNFRKNPKELATGFWGFLRDTLSLTRGGVDVAGTVKEIRESLVFSGFNVWVLMCSIVIASIGLNMNSTAVIIGAMLISPLMGPIRGIGLGVGMYDFKLIIRSLKNFGVATGISILTSLIYFWLSPINNETPELLGRTFPTLLDVLIAFFGGLAGIITAAKGMRSTVVPGVAIATALMPPLCTAGYGIAHANWAYFIGAVYLFLLNSLFICLSTILVIRYLKFPRREFVSSKIERKVKIYIIVFLVVIISPSGFLFYKMINKSIFEDNAQQYVEEVIGSSNEDLHYTVKYNYDASPPEIEINITPFYFPDEVITQWENQLKNYDLENARLKVIQGQDIEAEMNEFRNEMKNLGGDMSGAELLIREKENQLQSKDEKIAFYRNLYERTLQKNVDMSALSNRMKLIYPGLNKFAINEGLQSDFSTIDTLYTVMVHWKNDSLTNDKALQKKVGETVKLELELEHDIVTDSIRVISY